MATQRIMVVEDGESLGRPLSITLADAGYWVIGPVPTADLAAALIVSHRPDAVLLDVGLRFGTSFPVAELLTEQAIPFAFMTGREVDELPEHLQQVPLLSKPVGSDALLARIEALLRPSRLAAPGPEQPV